MDSARLCVNHGLFLEFDNVHARVQKNYWERGEFRGNWSLINYKNNLFRYKKRKLSFSHFYCKLYENYIAQKNWEMRETA